jgi:hypothetical protein
MTRKKKDAKKDRIQFINTHLPLFIGIIFSLFFWIFIRTTNKKTLSKKIEQSAITNKNK